MMLEIAAKIPDVADVICDASLLSAASSSAISSSQPPSKKLKTDGKIPGSVIEILDDETDCILLGEDDLIKFRGFMVTISDERVLVNNDKLND
uniref:Uncharacterized protein n=1 Tax=Amphimedon queenslandica TaxID=400682 RepID=A0A1X7V235_AMPQE